MDETHFHALIPCSHSMLIGYCNGSSWGASNASKLFVAQANMSREWWPQQM